MNRFFLHIGAGKTGTSALQSHFVINRDLLLEHNCYYPVANNDAQAQNLETTSGNAVELANLLRSDSVDKSKIHKLITQYIKEAEGKDILLSSEALEMCETENATILREAVEKGKYKIIIVYYVRAIGDHLVSSYHQLLKRHKYVKSFESVLQTKNNRFLAVIDKSVSVFGKDAVWVKNYDKVKKDIFIDFLQDILNIRESHSFVVKNKKVNRSLTSFEVSFMRAINQHLENSHQSAFISNTLIKVNSQANYNMSLSKKAYNMICGLYEEDTQQLNSYLKNEEQSLTLFDSVTSSDKEDEKNDLAPFQKAVIAILAELTKTIKK